MKVCVDIGGTKVAVTLAHPTPAGAVLISGTRCTGPTAKSGSSDALALQVLDLLEQSLELARQQGVALTPLEALGVSAERALMIGDRASHDGAAAAVGIASYILPGPSREGSREPRGLEAVLRLVGVAQS